MASGNERGARNELGALRAEQLPHNGHYNLTHAYDDDDDDENKSLAILSLLAAAA